MEENNSFSGRSKELSFLNEKYNSNKGQLVIIYGRRRVGKSETIRQFCKNKKAVFFTCTQTEDINQLKNFSNTVLLSGFTKPEYFSEFNNWTQALLSVKDFPQNSNGKRILVIDEFPYMAKDNNEIPSILQNLWDSTLKNENVLIILCGSAMSYIEKEVLSEKNPLYGRATGIYKMEPMPYYDAIKFFPSYSSYNKIASYCILGGIPYYLEQFKNSCSLKENIINAIIKKGSILYSEPEFLLRQELREPSTYNTIIQTIAFGKTKFNEIQQATLIEKGKLSVYLKNLVELGIVTKEFPLAATNASKQNVQRGIYKLKDLFFRFWYAFVFPNTSLLEFGDVQTVYNKIIAPKIDDFISMPFEDVCITWLVKQNMASKLPFTFTKIGRWWNESTEVDAIALDNSRKNLISAECKFHKTKCNIGDLQKHIEKDISDLKLEVNAKIFYYYFSWSGFTKEAISFAKENNITLVDGKSL